MDVTMLFSDSVEDSANGISDTASQKQNESGQGNGSDGDFCGKDNAPTHADITDHGELGILFEIDRRERDRHGSKSPYKPEDRPSPNGGYGTNGREQNWGIGASDQKVDGAMVKYLHHFFRHRMLQPVVNAGTGVKDDHRSTVNCASDNAPNVLVQCGKNHAKHCGDYTKSATHNVGDHIKNFFASGIVRQRAVNQFCSCHKIVLLSYMYNSIAHKATKINVKSVNNSKTFYVLRFSKPYFKNQE